MAPSTTLPPLRISPTPSRQPGKAALGDKLRFNLIWAGMNKCSKVVQLYLWLR